MKTLSTLLSFCLYASASLAQNVNVHKMPELTHDKERTVIQVPNIPGYQTLKCDFHIHTVFSDGNVWPTVRIDEAWQQGLDAIAITDHLEYQPHKEYVKGDHNTPYKLALPQAQKRDILLIQGTEITRSMPPGHFNALFISDANKLDQEDWKKAFEEAKKQDAYIIWNHPGWQAQQPDTCLWWDEHTALYEQGMIHAIEVFNHQEWYPISLDWCVEKKLAITASSDIHKALSELYHLKDVRRPMTLVLAKDRSLEAIQEALLDNRTIAWFGHTLAGRQDLLQAFYEAAVTWQSLNKTKDQQIFAVKNTSEVPFVLKINGQTQIHIPALKEIQVTLNTKEHAKAHIENLFIGSQRVLEVALPK